MVENGFCNISSLGKLRISGSSAHDFIRIMFTADCSVLETPGTVVASLLLTGEAEVIDVVLIIRTGDDEYMVTTRAQTVEEVYAWLESHAQIRDDQGAIFEGLKLSDETSALSAVVLFGEGSRAILDELAGGDLKSFPHVGALTMAQLDTVPALVLATPVLCGEAYELFFAPANLAGIENVLLSFPELEPLTFDEYRELRQQQGTWFFQAEEAAYTYPDEAALTHLLRTPWDFVGGKALSQRHS